MLGTLGWQISICVRIFTAKVFTRFSRQFQASFGACCILDTHNDSAGSLALGATHRVEAYAKLDSFGKKFGQSCSDDRPTPQRDLAVEGTWKSGTIHPNFL
jgi:hypothetical protein